MNRSGSSIPQSRRPLARGHAQPNAAAQANAAKLQVAVALHQQGRLDQAAVLYQEILKSQPRHFDALQLLATIAAQRKNSAVAVELFDQALKIKPDNAEALNNRGNALRDLKRPEEALESYERALKLKPDYVEAHWNESLCRLLTGDFDLGWQKYEWRWKTEPLSDKLRNFPQPLWLGEVPLAGKTLLLHAEQGFGDTLQFCRYAPLMAAQGARIVLEVQPALKSLSRSLPGVDTLLAKGEALPPFDYHAPLLSLPLALGTRLDSIPAEVYYLQADPKRVAAWKVLLGSRSKPRIGLAWSGRPTHPNEVNRTIPFALLDGLIDETAEFICLQKEIRDEDRKPVGQHPNLRIVSERLKDFADTAALIETLDLVITVDTSVAHLAGAMGKPVWILLPFSPDWRWLLDREDSPWYPSARLFRQPQLGQWAPVVAEVSQVLAKQFTGYGGERRQEPSLAPKPLFTASVEPLVTAVQANAAKLQAAVALHQQGKFDQAEALYQEILKSQPRHFDAQQLLATIAAQRKNSAVAVELFDQALKIKPDNAEALNNRGNALRDLKRPEDALESYDRALKVKPDYAEALYNRGNALRDLKHLEEALESYDRAIKLKPDYAEALNNRGVALRDLKRLAEALESYERALEFKPDYAEALNNRGNALRDLKRLAEALESYEHALKIKPDHAKALINRGSALLDLKRHEEALESYERALQIKPDYADAHLNESLCRLLTGDFDLGWKKYEWRWKKAPGIDELRNFSQPLWLGEVSLEGKTVLLHAEQGFGDTLQFCRYAPMIAARGARVVLEVQPALKSLCRSLPGVDTLLAKGEALPPFDYHAPLLSLPLAFCTRLDTIPAHIPYLYADPDKIAAWQNTLGSRSKPRIGLAWSGSPTHKNDHNRSIPFALLAELIDETAEFMCLQKEIRSEDEKLVHQQPNLRIVSERLNDFADTAALIETLDLVITVDTSVAHLAGAMGKPVWILLPFSPDWRWLLDRADSPWYPSARLFRQPQFDQWEPVVAEVRQALGCLPRDTVWKKAHRVPTGSASASVVRKPSVKTQASSAISEINRRHEVIEALQTDMVRWSDEHQLESAWGKRAEFAARFIPAGARVLAVGCGAMALEKHLPSGCTYFPCDVVARDSRTKVCDLNSGDYPEDQLQSADIVVMLGVVEYIYKASELLARLAAAGRPVLVSYCPSDNGMTTPRNDLGWVNHYRREEFGTLLRQAGFHVRRCDPIDGVQWLFLAVVESLPTPLPATKKVLVLSYNNVGNFGDRLGYHQIHSVLPSQAVVTHSHFKPWDVPTDDFDMLVLGIGNSLFAPLLTDKLLALLDRIPRKIGIFGTQYRADIPAQRLQAVLDRLDHWYARYDEDVLLYGRGRDNVTHLGDWLINAFPMASGKDERMLKIGQEIWQDLPLDRTIQKIQAHRKVYSTRLHPLLCALTSAEAVAYVEQRENSAAKPSGKFRSLLLDVFGREMPEDQFWNVDRDAVMSYKMFVTRQIEKLQTTLSEALLK